jgi:putrescine aminotransferase
MTVLTEPATTDVVTLLERHVSRSQARFARFTGGLAELSSQGAWVTCSDGQRYLDAGGYGVFILGHRHPAVVAAVHAQLDAHPLATRLLVNPVQAAAAARLAAVTPAGLDYVYFANSGAEAVEAALKLARAGGHTRLVSAQGGFHGKTLGALSVTANPLYQDAFRPLLPDCVHVPYGDPAALEAAVATHPGRACVVVEPVQAEGGVVIPPDGYLTAVAQACRRHGALLVVDEIQTGLGRLGTWWGLDRDGVVPDIMLVGKGLSGGVVPVAAAVCSPAAFAPLNRDPYLHSSTFGGSPLAAAAALAAIDAIDAEGIVPRAAALGARLLDGLRAVFAEEIPELVRDVRGCGLLLGMELRDPGVLGELVLALLDQRVIANHSLNAHTVLRLTPPATLAPDEEEFLLAAVRRAAVAVRATARHH